MKEYVIKKSSGWDDIKRAYISEYPWGDKYTPKAYFQAFYDEQGINIRLCCEESNPKAVYSGYMAPVYKDSCLEFFASYGNGGYINCEVNSNGASLIAYGKDRHERTPLLDLCGELPTVNAFKEDGCWYATVMMPYSILKKVYPDFDARKGYVFFGNAYKCGDDCDVAHYGMWNSATCEKPDFHRPEFFGKFILD